MYTYFPPFMYAVMELTISKYLADPVLWFYYTEIKKSGSAVGDVDNFYNNMLRDYFSQDLMFGVEHDSWLARQDGMPEKLGFMIRYVKSGVPRKVMLIDTEDKRSDKELQASQWADALDRVARYAKLVRMEEGQDKKKVLYLTVNIRTYIRFYQLDPWESEAREYAPTGGHAYELAQDEEMVHRFFTELVAQTMA